MICRFCGADITSDLLHELRCDGRQGKVEAAFEPYRAPHAAGSATSAAAARSIEPTASSLCAQILAVLKERPMTCAEVELRFALRHQTASARIWDLRTRQYIRDSGQRRPTSSGRNAVVWEVIPA